MTKLATLAFLAIALPLTGGFPVVATGPQDPVDPIPVECSCALSGYVLQLSNCAQAGGTFPTIEVTYSSDAQSGTCLGSQAPCSVDNECSGVVTVKATAAAFQGITDGVAKKVIWTEVFDMSACGDRQSVLLSVFGNPVGNHLCTIELVARCPACN